MKSLNLPYNPRIDHLRWLAATIVFLFHSYLIYRQLGGEPFHTSWAGIVAEGHTGVGLFFVLSGFLFMQIAQRQQQLQYGDFMRNRFLRIFPLFLTIFLVATSIGRDKFVPQDILYLFATNLGLAPTSSNPITGAAWCISLEFLFYAVFPFLARFTLEQGARYLVKLLVMMMFFKLAAYNVNDNATLMYFSTFVGRFDQFLIGMLAAVLFQRHGGSLQRFAPVLFPLALLAAFVNSAVQMKFATFGAAPKSVFWIFWSTQEALGWVAVIVAWVAWDAKLPAWIDRALCQGGKISFSFYLLHMAMIHMLGQWLGKLPRVTGVAAVDTGLLLVLFYGATWALATVSYSAIEEPFLRMRRSYGRNAVLGEGPEVVRRHG